MHCLSAFSARKTDQQAGSPVTGSITCLPVLQAVRTRGLAKQRMNLRRLCHTGGQMDWTFRLFPCPAKLLIAYLDHAPPTRHNATACPQLDLLIIVYSNLMISYEIIQVFHP